ncbi:hypothetical protein EV702DRAFT_1093045 [Suillus placidus]|uniref:Uncharacterized protein n=1 Tax=Suillus placidus TaxID=48579 RepID=A0A9P6ZY01_9AGAM|nr:hypothetical protein EV702DRAFT_1093045 [Suillus placidus]
MSTKLGLNGVPRWPLAIDDLPAQSQIWLMFGLVWASLPQNFFACASMFNKLISKCGLGRKAMTCLIPPSILIVTVASKLLPFYVKRGASRTYLSDTSLINASFIY